MAYALVGTPGAVTTSTSGGSAAPAWSAGASRTAGNLLICVVSGTGTSTTPGTPTGWSQAVSASSSGQATATIFYKIAAGSDAAPTISGVASTVLSAQLYEFSGNAAVPLDQIGTASGTTFNLTPTAGGKDAQPGELVIVAGAANYTIAGTKTLSAAISSAYTFQTTNNSTSATGHYVFSYGEPVRNSVADFAGYTQTTANIGGGTVALASFKVLVAQPTAPVPQLKPHESQLITEVQFDGDPIANYYDTITMDNPVVLLRLGEATGTTAYDTWNDYNDGVYNGGCTLAQPGVLAPPAFLDEAGGTNTTGYDLNTSVLFDGTSGYVSRSADTFLNAIQTDVGHALDVNGSVGGWTVEAWINPTTIQSFPGASDTTAIVTKAYPGSGSIPFVLGYGQITQSDTGAGMGGSSGAQVWLGFYNGTWHTIADPVALTSADAGTWIHYVGTWDGTGLTLYRNGVRVAVGVPLPGFAAASSSQPMYIGRRWDTGGTVVYFSGKIDEVAVYSKALSQTQVTSHYAAQKVRISPTWIDISADVMSAQTQRGRTYELDAYQAGTATVVLDDAERNYDASNNNSPYNGGDAAHPWYRILPLRPIRIRGAANDLDNPDFESALSGTDWVALSSAALSLDTANFENGTQSLKVITAATTGSGVRSQRVSMMWSRLAAGVWNTSAVNIQLSDVRTSAWIYADSGNSVRYYLQELDASNNILATSTIQTIAGGSATWTYVQLAYTLTNTATTQVQIIFDVPSNSAATFHVDNARVAPVWPIFQGFVDAWPETWEPPDYATTSLTAVDGFEPLTQAQIETTTLNPVPQDTAYAQVYDLLDLSYWPSSMRYITHSDVSDTTHTMASIDGTQGTDYGLTLLQDVANSDLGGFFMGKDGKATYQDWNYRANIASLAGAMGAFSDDEADLISGAALEYADMQTSFDQQRITNDWTVSPDPSASPATVGRAINADSIRRYLRRSNTRSTRLQSATDAQTQANNLVTRTSGDSWTGGAVTPTAVMRIESIAIEPLNSRNLWRQALQREISDLISVARTPGGGVSGGSSGLFGSFFIEQITWNIVVDAPWRVSWQLSPYAFSIGAHPFQLDVSPYDNLDQGHPLT